MMERIGLSTTLAAGLCLAASGVVRAQAPGAPNEEPGQPPADQGTDASPGQGAQQQPQQHPQQQQQPQQQQPQQQQYQQQQYQQQQPQQQQPQQQHPQQQQYQQQHPQQGHPQQQQQYQQHPEQQQYQQHPDYGPPPEHGHDPHGAPPPRKELRPAPNSVFFEGLGAGLLYSVNYERRFADDFGIRAGFGYWGGAGGILSVPLTLSYLGVRGASHGLELGAGATIFYATGVGTWGVGSFENRGLVWGTANVGYRYHPAGGAGFQFRAGLMMFYGKGLGFSVDHTDVNRWGAIPWPYVSFGAGF